MSDFEILSLVVGIIGLVIAAMKMNSNDNDKKNNRH